MQAKFLCLTQKRKNSLKQVYNKEIKAGIFAFKYILLSFQKRISSLEKYLLQFLIKGKNVRFKYAVKSKEGG